MVAWASDKETDRCVSLFFPTQDACKAGKDAVDALMKKSLEAVAGDEKKEKGVAEYFDIYQDLRGRFADMMAVMIEDIRGVDDIKVDAGKLNLAY